MAYCPACSATVSAGWAFCKQCGGKLDPAFLAQAAPTSRPGGLTAIAVLCFISAGGLLFALTQARAELAFIMGALVPLPIYVVVQLAFAAINVVCGIGFLKRSNAARLVYMGYAVFVILNVVPTTMAVLDAVDRGALDQPGIPSAFKEQLRMAVYTGTVAGVVIGLALQIFILWYLVTRKSVFTTG